MYSPKHIFGSFNFAEFLRFSSWSHGHETKIIKMRMERTSSPTHKATTHSTRLQSNLCWNPSRDLPEKNLRREMETTIQLLHLLSIFHFLQYSRAILNQHLFPGSSVECKFRILAIFYRTFSYMLHIGKEKLFALFVLFSVQFIIPAVQVELRFVINN